MSSRMVSIGHCKVRGSFEIARRDRGGALSAAEIVTNNVYLAIGQVKGREKKSVIIVGWLLPHYLKICFCL
jgi:hypothetical protein